MIEQLRLFIDAWNRGDIDAILSTMHPDVEFRRFSGTGREGVPVTREGGQVAAGRDGLILDLRAHGSWAETLAAAGLEE